MSLLPCSLAVDSGQEFGQKVGDFVSDIKSRSKEPYQKLLSEVYPRTVKLKNDGIPGKL